ncbi:alpha-L-arabinofuranosidase II precursor [Streptomyces sp. NL15-2K]|nr:alpha-L-arabinofuranosidase II precursor [Streptomyces sp. NL15-2K]
MEQNLYIARMSDPTTPTGGRHVISQPREGWEMSDRQPVDQRGPRADQGPERPAAHRVLGQRLLDRPVLPGRPAAEEGR